MHEWNDNVLLRHFAKQNSEAAPALPPHSKMLRDQSRAVVAAGILPAVEPWLPARRKKTHALPRCLDFSKAARTSSKNSANKNIKKANGQVINRLLVFGFVRPEITLRERLVREIVAHRAARMTVGAAEVHGS